MLHFLLKPQSFSRVNTADTRRGPTLPDELRHLVRRCVAGQHTAQLDFFHRFQGQVFGFCLRMLGQREDAEDCTQETFIRVLRNLHRWDPARRIEPWLFTIAGNRCRTRLSNRLRRPKAHSLEVPVEDHSQRYRDAELLSEEIDMALSGIRGEYAKAFSLFHRHEMSYDEIAEVMSVPLGTIKTWVHRARRDLVAKLASRGVVQELNRELRTVREPNSTAIG